MNSPNKSFNVYVVDIAPQERYAAFMANGDWWAQAAQPRTVEEQAHAQQAMVIEQQWHEEAQAAQAERGRRKGSALSYLSIAAGALIGGVGAWAFGFGPYQGFFYAVAVIFGYRGIRQLISTI